jgi:hypothetical protein
VTQASIDGPDCAAPALRGPSHEQINLLLLDALQKLADAGEADAACRIAGKACAILRRAAPKDERRFNALLHRLVRKP